MRLTGRFENYNVSALRKDLVSGLIVGIIAIPLGMAFAIASGVKPEYGLYTTIIAGILISLLGGSRFQIGGPTGAFIPILLAIVMQYGYENMLAAGFLAGIILVIMGICRLGVLIAFIPRPVTIGFTAGIAVIIFSGQIPHFLGLSGLERHELFWPNMKEIATHLGSTNLYSVLTAGISMAVILLMPKVLPKMPASLAGLVISSTAAAWFFEGQVVTIGSAYGGIPTGLPPFQWPNLTWEHLLTLWQPAFVIALLGGIESLLSAVVADGMTGTRHNSNRELIGQGIANMVAPLFGGIPATGAIARTATNIRSGAVSPVSGIFHGFVVLCVLLVFAPYATHIPLASMAPLLMVVAWNMSERKHFLQILRTKTSDSVVLVVTFVLTVFSNLTTAVEIGLILAILLFVRRMGGLVNVSKVLPDPSHKHEKVLPHMVHAEHDCPQISIYTVEGPLFFGAANRFEQLVMEPVRQSKATLFLLRMGKVPLMDTTGAANMASLVKLIKANGGRVLLTGIQRQPLDILKKSGLYGEIGEEHIYQHTGDAINFALTQLDRHTCLGCKYFVFRECAALSVDGDLQRASASQKVYGGVTSPVE